MFTYFGAILIFVLHCFQDVSCQSTATVVITAANGKSCVGKFRLLKDGDLLTACQYNSSSFETYCATAVDSDQVILERSNCTSMATCSLTTKNGNGNTCKTFTLSNVTYPAGTCAYLYSYNSLPWCATTDNVLGENYLGSEGQVNWDYCNPACLVS